MKAQQIANMKISQLIEVLEILKISSGDLEVCGRGHPGEIGSELDIDNIQVEDDNGNGSLSFIW